MLDGHGKSSHRQAGAPRCSPLRGDHLDAPSIPDTTSARQSDPRSHRHTREYAQNTAGYSICLLDQSEGGPEPLGRGQWCDETPSWAATHDASNFIPPQSIATLAQLPRRRHGNARQTRQRPCRSVSPGSSSGRWEEAAHHSAKSEASKIRERMPFPTNSRYDTCI